MPPPSIHFIYSYTFVFLIKAFYIFVYFGLREQGGVYVENITEEEVQSEAAVLSLLARGSGVRSKGETQVTADRLPYHPLA